MEVEAGLYGGGGTRPKVETMWTRVRERGFPPGLLEENG